MHEWRKIIALCMVMGAAMALTLPVWAEEVENININTAPVEELIQLEGVGFVSADRIIEYREEHGPFTCAEDLMNVPGIGPDTCEVNESRITVE